MLQLPPELVVVTLSHATLIDIVRCKLVCKTFNTVINESTTLQYLIELGCAGYVDGNYGKGTLLQHERLRRLIEIESAWREFSLATKTKFKIPGVFPTPYEFGEGVFICGHTKLDTIRSTSVFGDVTSDHETRTLSQTQPPVKAVCDVAIDPGSDLLILLEDRDEDEGIDGESKIYDFHIRSLSTYLPHAAAQKSVITYRAPAEVGDIATTVIVEDLLSAMFSYALQDGDGELVIWNWKTGEKIARLRGSFPPLTTCTFLSPAVFIIPQTRTSEGALKAYLAVYAIPSSEQGGVVTPCLLAMYNMPAFSPKVTGCTMVVRFNAVPNPQNVAHADDGFRENPICQSFSKPFYGDPLKRIFVISMRIIHLQGPSRLEIEGFTVFLHSDAFLRLLGEQTVRTGLPSTSTLKNFKWDEYCKYARMTEGEPRDSFIRFVHGQRYLDYKENSLHIWDFNSYFVKRKESLARALPGGNQEEAEIPNKEVISENALPDGEETVQRSTPGNDGYLLNARPTDVTEGKWASEPVYSSGPAVIENVTFRDKVWSSLPYQRITSRTKFDDLDGAMMDGERIILLKKNYETAHLELTVMSIVPEPDQDKPDS
ncbi:hypothetical protein FRB95_000828 [Tulasnella sp. JGI-2019a]|nr:hypothetical protein FRB95_000828 [Tulasnella sp. JGI-2019a]